MHKRELYSWKRPFVAQPALVPKMFESTMFMLI